MEITAAYRSHFTFRRWTRPGCKGQLSESFYVLQKQLVACLNMTDYSGLDQDSLTLTASAAESTIIAH